MGVAVLDSYMFAVGGQDGVSCLNFVERYDPQLNKWTKVASMSTRRLGVGVAVLGGYLYAVGGSDGTSPLNTGKISFQKYCNLQVCLITFFLVEHSIYTS